MSKYQYRFEKILVVKDQEKSEAELAFKESVQVFEEIATKLYDLLKKKEDLIAYQNSVSKGGDFANNIIGSVAKGDPKTVGTIVGQNASDAMTSYFGFTGKPNAPSFRDVEIGGGKIMGKEITTTNPNPTEFAMYNADQYMQPEGKFTMETAADGSKWYKQTPQDVVEKTPYYDANGDVKYNETIVQKMPQIPRRKDRV